MFSHTTAKLYYTRFDSMLLLCLGKKKKKIKDSYINIIWQGDHYGFAHSIILAEITLNCVHKEWKANSKDGVLVYKNMVEVWIKIEKKDLFWNQVCMYILHA